MSVSQDSGEPIVLRFLDVSRAHPHVPIKRLVYIELPAEAMAPPGMCGRLNGLLYGCRDAPQGFEFFVCEILVTEGGFTVGRFSSCIFWHAERRIRVWVHGDDFIISATRANSLWVLQLLRRRLIVKDRGVLGPLSTDLKEIRCMQRTIRWVDAAGSAPERIEYEADSRHAQLLVRELGLSNTSRGAPKPSVKTQLSILDGEPS